MSAQILQQAFDSTQGVLAKVSPKQLTDSTPCASWKVRDLVNHIVGGATYFAVTAETGTAPAGGDVPDFTSGDMNEAFALGADRAVASFGTESAMDKTMTLPSGALPGSVFMWIAATDTFTHGWDLAKATGQSTDLDRGLAEQLLEAARASIPDAMRGPEPQPFGPVVEVPESASAADRLAGFLGRRP